MRKPNLVFPQTAGSGKYTTGMLEYLLNAADGILDDAPIYEQELRDAKLWVYELADPAPATHSI